MSQKRPWWAQDERWRPRLTVAGACAALGAAVLWLGNGLGSVLGAEAGFGVAAGFTVAAGIGLGGAWRGRADDDPGTYAEGVVVDLVPTGTTRGAPIAFLSSGEATLAELHLETLHPDGSPVYGIDTVTARVTGRVLRLQHRRPSLPVGGGDDDIPDLEVRWVDDQDVPVASAFRTPGSGGARWTIPARRISLTWTVPAQPDRRPARRFLIDVDQQERVFLLVHTHRTRLPRVQLTAPVELDPAEALLCVWLCHLLDAHAAGRERWPLPSDEEWVLVPDDFPLYAVGPGGFGRISGMPLGGSGGF